MAAHELYLTDDKGRRLAGPNGQVVLDNIYRGTFNKVTNKCVNCNVRLPIGYYDLMQEDRMIQYWRQATGGRLALFQSYFIRYWHAHKISDSWVLDVIGLDPLDLLRRRIVANYAGTTEANKTDYADDMMKEIVDEQMVNDASDPAPTWGSRDWASLSVQGDTGDGPSITRAVTWDNVLESCQDIAEAARSEGTEVFFDVVPIVGASSISFQFRTKTGQPGADVSDSVTFDEALGNLWEPSLTYNARVEENYIYAGGMGQEDNRDIQQAYNTTRINVSQWNRCEGFAYASYQRTADGVLQSANQELNEKRPIEILSGRAVDMRGTRFGVHWNWGDRVTARVLGREFTSIIRAVTIRLDENGQEHVEPQMEYEP